MGKYSDRLDRQRNEVSCNLVTLKRRTKYFRIRYKFMSHTRRLQLAYVCHYGVGAEDLIMKLFTVRDTMPADADRGGALPR